MEDQNFLVQNKLTPFHPESGVLYKYVSFDTAKKIIENSSLRFGTASSFNDPFELSLDYIDLSISKNELNDFIKKKHPGSRKSNRALFRKNKDKHSLKGVRNVMIDEFQKLKNTTGICCFSKRNNITLMWSHYAEQHKGLCLGFRNFVHSPNFFVVYVNYITELKPVKYWDFGDELFPLWIFSKSHVWEYEEEVRAVYFDKEGLVKFNKTQLCEVHFGLRVMEENQTQIIDLIQHKNYTNISFFDMKINNKDFAIMRVKKI